MAKKQILERCYKTQPRDTQHLTKFHDVMIISSCFIIVRSCFHTILDTFKFWKFQTHNPKALAKDKKVYIKYTDSAIGTQHNDTKKKKRH
jgi:hypothetical protein